MKKYFYQLILLLKMSFHYRFNTVVELLFSNADLLITVLFANFAESVAEGRGKAQAASLKKTQKETKAHRLDENGNETIVSSSELRRGDIVMVSAGEIVDTVVYFATGQEHRQGGAQ